MPDVPDLPDPLPEVPAAPSPAEALAPSLDLLGESRARVQELERLKLKVTHLQRAHEAAMRDYRAELDFANGKLVKANEDATRARNEVDVLARALRDLAEAAHRDLDSPDEHGVYEEFFQALTRADEVLLLWGRK